MTDYTEDQITAGAKWLARNVVRYGWDGLRPDGRAADAGFPAWGIGGHLNARQEDYRDAIRGILAAMGAAAPGAKE